MKTLSLTLFLSLSVCPLVGAPVVTFGITSVTVTVPAGHRVAWMVLTGQSTMSGIAADPDADGQVVIPMNPHPGLWTIVDLESGDHAVVSEEWSYPLDPLTPGSVVRGTNGSISQLILPTDRPPAVLWVRPGLGAWSPEGGFPTDADNDSYNGVLFYDATMMRAIDSSPAVPGGFAHGDLLITLPPYYGLVTGGVVDALLDAPPNGGTLSFVSEGGLSVSEGIVHSAKLMRTGGADGTVSVRCRSVAGTAEAGVDFMALDQIVTFGPGETLKTVQVATINDDLFATERKSFSVSLTDPVGAALGTRNTYDLIINDDDPFPRAAFAGLPATVPEGDVPWTLQVPVTLTGAFRGSIEVRLQELQGSISETVTFLPGEPRKEIAVPIAADDIPGPNRQHNFSLLVAGSQHDQASMTVVDDDQPQLSIDDVTAVEGSVRARVLVKVPAMPASQSSLTWTTVDGTAKAGQDFVATSRTTILQQTTTELAIDLIADTTFEQTETFYVDVTAMSGPIISTRTRIAITLYDDDSGTATPAVTIVPALLAVTEGSQMDVLVKLASAVPSSAVSLTFITTGLGTARTPSDYVAVSETLEFAPGETQKTVRLTINDDWTDEPDETFEVAVLENGVVRTWATITILDTDGISFTGVTDTTIEEKTGTSAFAVFRVTVTPAPDVEVRLDYATADVTATAGSDYVAKSGTLVFARGQTSAEVRVEVLGDGVIEPAETFTLRLSNVVGAYLHGDRGTATIFDDDSPAPPVAIANASVLEGDAGPTPVGLKVILAHALTHAVTLTVATSGTGTASASDYQPLTQSVTFAAGQTELTVNATVLGDTSSEGNETFGVEIREGSAVRASATVTIVDDDTPMFITVADVTVQEKTGPSVPAVFRVTISPAPVTPATIEFTTANGTARAESDYTAFAGTILFFPGQSVVEVPVEVLGDAIDEPAETFTLRLSSAVGAVIQDDRATATIVDDDASSPSSVFSVVDATVTEKTGTSAFAVFPVTLSPSSTSSASIAYTTEDGTALSGLDYLPASGTLVFNPGQTEREVRVEVFGDAVTEGAETLRLRLSSPVGADLAVSTATATILDDDIAVVNPTVSVADIEVREGNGVTEATFTLTLSKALPGTVRVTFSTVEHSAVPPRDYEETSGLVTFAPGETTRSVIVHIQGDRLPEQNELFRLELRSSDGVPIGDGNAICTIIDDDMTTTKRRAARH